MSRKNEPTLAFKRGDLAVQLNEHDCGSLMYKGGFLPYALIGDIENEKYRRLVLSEDMLPAEATERTNLISADEDWPLPDCSACFVPKKQVEEDNQFVGVVPYVIVINTSGAVLAYGRDKGPAHNTRWSIGMCGTVCAVDMSIHTDEDKNLIDVGKTIRNAAMREFRAQSGRQIKHALFPLGLIHLPDDTVGKNYLGVVMFTQILSTVPAEEDLSNQVLSTRWVGDNSIGRDVHDDQIEGWTKKLLEMKVPEMAAAI